MDEIAFPNRRMPKDRRQPVTWTAWRWVFGGRRREVRRTGEEGTHRIDWYPAGLLGAVVLVLTLSTLDAVLTLALVDHGLATEANPFMAPLVDANVGKFISLKTALTGCCVILLVLYSQVLIWNRFKAGNALYPIAALYAALVGYELSLITLV